MMSAAPLDQTTRNILTTIVEKQEGGWKLWHTEGDDDGYWTFAGCTAKAFVPWLNKRFSWSNVSVEDTKQRIEKAILQGGAELDSWKEIVFNFYHDQYVIPLSAIVGTGGNTLFEISCIINCGFSGCKSIYINADSRTKDTYELNFEDAWVDHYVAIVVKDPGKLKFLNGWINRVRACFEAQ